ncbi:helix-turn-helix transcriptional regulator [Flavobacterium psychrophilum]|uniref:Helix-turn-helix transcriptional regulator n=2 Tax=Flavobacterium psychrophilum TaxID=96345 RepID=A0A7U2NF63_FLAPS|nr:helix-turn-helix transcriptional regulator [Flavobacterium psychrophilum]ELM3651075.1 helix-turn-helix transcriptional regulator [Flavobacterium psychrophilum]ELM3670990.1 helix-turn-helix transcriptional regulator [Flavobacterium psychrophilum]ELM3726435.1 helix-turn-helix transcriptional regulator [Flavobacterium psychrophilum]ELV7526220.1 helix-turn-helix transcriptional regulator [Flavobacterium psychrophilum]ELY2009372.1 helix-turn-helix transcriptional regulator [Flavobacterium psychr
MKTTQLLRDQLGLSQEMMAQYLEITLSQLAMYETGKRELPTGALIKLSVIVLFFEQKQEVSSTEKELLKQEQVKVQEIINRKAKELEYKQIKAQRALDKIQKKHKQSLQLNLLAQYLQKNKTEKNNVLLQQALIGINKYGLANQTIQILNLESIKSQLNYVATLKKSE